jgi:hypothetical protein
MTGAAATEARVPGHLLGGVPELGIPADTEVSRAAVMQHVLDAWGLVYPLRFAVQVLLAFGQCRDPRIAVLVALFFVAVAREVGITGKQRDSDLQASSVAAMFGFGPRFRAALIYLRWAALAGTRAERNNHLDGAMEHLEAILAEVHGRELTP